MKINRLLLAALLGSSLALSACGSNDAQDTGKKDDQTETGTETSKDDPSKKSEGVMTYQEYIDAADDAEVTIEAYVQDKQDWWEDKATLYLADPDGAYFVYNANCSQDLYNELSQGTKVKVTGYKTTWSGEVEVAEGADLEKLEGNYIEPVTNVTDMLGKEELIDYQNRYVEFDGMTIEASDDAGAAYLYNYDGSGQEGDDLYFKASKDGETYTFTVESYLRGKDTDVYKAVQNLKVGDVVTMKGFLYWYEGANPHITELTVDKAE